MRTGDGDRTGAGPAGPAPLGRPVVGVVALSAKDDEALRDSALRCADAWEECGAPLSQVCASLAVGRSGFRSRLAFVADDSAAALATLRRFGRTGSAPGVRTGALGARVAHAPVVLLLPGGVPGRGLPGGGAGSFPDRLHAQVEPFRQAVDEVAESAAALGVSRADVLGGDPTLAAFAARYAAGRMWRVWGLVPDVVVAAPETEHAARCLGGEISLDEAVSRLVRGDPPGSCGGPLPTGPEILIAGPAAGGESSVAEAAAALTSRGVFTLLQAGGDPALIGRVLAGAAEGTSAATAFTGGEDMTARGVLAALPELFVRGRPLDWSGVRRGPRSVRLPGHPFRRSRLWLPGIPDPLTATAPAPAAGGTDDDRPDGRLDEDMADVGLFLRGELAQLLGTTETEVSDDVPLLELGADSLVFARIVQRVAERFGVTLTVRELFEDLLTVEEIARHVAGSMAAPTHVATGPETPAVAPAPAVPGASAGEAGTTAAIEALQAHVRSLTAELSELRGRTADSVTGTTPGAAPPGPAVARQPFPGRDRYVADVISRYLARTAASREHAERHQDRLSNNRRFAAATRPEVREIRYPICGERSAGSRMWDADGSEYVDLSMGFGSHLLGHSPDVVMTALAEQTRTGLQLGPASRTTGEVAELISELTGAERMLFCASGTEAVMTAIRLARAATGRPKVVLFSKAYHGHFDGTLVSSRPDDTSGGADPMVVGTTRSMVDDVIVLPLDRDGSLTAIAERAAEIAAVVVEPVQNGNPGLHPADFLRRLRQVTQEHGVALVFDEVLTGFRVHPGGCQEYFGIQADLVTYGKTLAAGLPMAAVTGRREFLDLVDGGSWVGERRVTDDRRLTYTAGTYANHPLALAAARAVLGHLRDRGPVLYKELNERSDAMMERLNTGFAELGVPLGVSNLGSFFRFAQNSNFSFVHQPVEMDLFRANLALRGVYVAETGASFLSTAHTDEDTGLVVAAALDAAAEMRDAGLWRAGSRRSAASLAARPARVDAAVRPAPVEAADPEPAAAGHPAALTGVHDHDRGGVRPQAPAPPRGPALSLSYFGDSRNIDVDEHFRLLVEGAEFADQNGFAAVWFPERHFDSFGGFSPNPAIWAAALAQRTTRVALRAGSVVAPLHHPARIAEEWAMVDRMSGGRVGMAFASGWNDRDFVLAPGSFADRRDVTMRRVEQVRRLWRGEEVDLSEGGGGTRVGTFPRPVQRELPLWLTTLGSQGSFAAAGRAGTGVLTNLLNQDVTELKAKIASYRQARARAGHDEGHVTVLVHTLVGDDRERTRAAAAGPLEDYLSAALDLTNRMSRAERRIDPERLAPSDRDYLIASAREKYIRHRSLIGGVDDCRETVAALADAGVDEIACFVDFGVRPEAARAGFEALDRLRRECAADAATPAPDTSRPTVTLISAGHPAVPEGGAGTADATLPGPGGASRPPIGSPTEPATPSAALPTTANQRLVWAAAQFGPEASSAYNLRRLLRLTGPLDLGALRAAFRALVGRHDALRVALSDDGTEQYVRPAPDLDLALVDLSRLAEPDRAHRVAAFLDEEAGRPFDLAGGPLIRASLVKESAADHLLCLTVHHVAADGSAENVLLDEIGRLYARELGQGEELPAPPRLADHLPGPASPPPAPADLDYWRQRFTPLPPPLALTRRSAAPQRVAGHAGARLHFDLDAELLGCVRKFGAAHGASPFMVVLAAYTLLLHRIADQDDVVVGVPVSRRSAEGPDRDLVAYRADLLPIRSTGAPGTDFAGHLLRIRRTLLDAFDHEACSLADIMAVLPKREVWGRPSVVTAVFSWDRPVVPAMPGVTVAHVESGTRTVRFDLGLNVTHFDSGHRVSWDYSAAVFDEEDVRRLHARFDELLRRAVGAPVPTVTAPDLVARYAARRPDTVATCDQGVPLALGQVVERARTVAARLVAHGVRPADPVGLAVEPGPGLLVGLLGVLWSGGRCVPLGATSTGAAHPAVVLTDRARPAYPDDALVDLNAWTSAPLPDLPALDEDLPALEPADGQCLTHGQLVGAVAESVSRYEQEADPDRAAASPETLAREMTGAGPAISLLASAAGGRRVRWAALPGDPAPEGRPEPGRVSEPSSEHAPEKAGEHAAESPAVARSEPRPATGPAADAVRELTAIWSQVLGRGGLTPESDFFEEGGDSIRAVQILSKIRARFHRDLPVDTFFDAPTLGELAERVLVA